MMFSRYTILLVLAVLLVGASGYSNGQYPSEALSRTYHPSQVVNLGEGGPASSFNTFRICSVRAGTDVYANGPNSGYRARYPASRYGTQEWFWRHQPPLAARPGFSNHGVAKAVDLATPAMRRRINEAGALYSWKKVEAPSEWWHVNYVGGWGAPDPGLSARYPVLRVGSGRACLTSDVREVQRRLGIKQDGSFGSNTAKALVAFKITAFGKESAGTPVVTQATWEKLRSSVTTKARSTEPQTLRAQVPAMRGTDVTTMQGLLVARLHESRADYRVQITGAYGKQSQEGIRRFKIARGLGGSSTIGAKTWLALRQPSKSAVQIAESIQRAKAAE